MEIISHDPPIISFYFFANKRSFFILIPEKETLPFHFVLPLFKEKRRDHRYGRQAAKTSSGVIVSRHRKSFVTHSRCLHGRQGTSFSRITVRLPFVRHGAKFEGKVGPK
jgi:hypothetical protein